MIENGKARARMTITRRELGYFLSGISTGFLVGYQLFGPGFSLQSGVALVLSLVFVGLYFRIRNL